MSEPQAPPRVVAFDLMDTVVRDPFREALEAATGLPVQELFRRKGSSGWPAFERGELTEDEYWQDFVDAGIAFDPEAFHRARTVGYRWVAGMRELLDDLAGAVMRIVASNYPVWIDELADGMLLGRFERVLASYHLGARKPETSFFERFLVQIGAEAHEVLFVDDRPVNVDGAHRAGLRAHRFVDAADLRARLVAEGVQIAVAPGGQPEDGSGT